MTESRGKNLETLLCRVIPEWRTEILECSKISGGMTNENYCVRVHQKPFFVRLAGDGTEQLGIDRDVEYLATVTAGDLGVAPPVKFYVREERILVTEFVIGKSMSSEDFHDAHRLRQVVELLHRTHQRQPAVKPFSVFHVIRSYWNLVRGHHDKVTRQLEAALQLGTLIEERLPFQPLGLCHNDLLAANFVLQESTQQLWLVDWEYAGLGNLYFDLGNFASNQKLSADQEVLLANLYFETDQVCHHVAAIRLMRIMSDLRESLWGMVQRLVSPLDFDFEQYAMEHFSRVQQALDDPRIQAELDVLGS